MRFPFLVALGGVLVVPAFAQNSAPKTPAKPAAKTGDKADPKSNLEIIKAGELRLDGKITALLGEGVWQIEANSWTSPRGVSTDFEEPKTKGVTLAPGANVHPRGEAEPVPLREVKLASRVAIIGKNGADGSLVAREVILLEGYGSRRTVGAVTTHPFTSALVKQSREARDAGQLPKALQIIDKAIATAKGLSDLGGEGLATQDKALLHTDLGQPEEALKAFNRVQAIGRTMGNSLLISLGLNGAASMLRAAGQNAKALELLKEADTTSARSEPAIHLSILGSLATTYLIAGQLQDGIATLNRVAPLEEAAGKDGDAGETQLLVAALTATERAAAARQALKDVQPRIDRARDEKSKAGLIGTAALVRWRLGEKDAARAGFTQAAQLLQTAGAGAEAKRWEGMAAQLEGAGEGWQKFFFAASGIKVRETAPTGQQAPPAETPPAETPPK